MVELKARRGRIATGLYIVAVAVGSQRKDGQYLTASIDHFLCQVKSTDSRAMDNWCKGVLPLDNIAVRLRCYTELVAARMFGYPMNIADFL